MHTGQHYDDRLSDVFFADLAIPQPDVHLGVGSGSHGVQTGTMLAALDAVLDGQRPDWVLVYGDTNSTIAGTLSAVKMHLPVAHLEAGLRSFNRACPRSTTGCSPTTPPTCSSPRRRSPSTTSPARVSPSGRSSSATS